MRRRRLINGTPELLDGLRLPCPGLEDVDGRRVRHPDVAHTPSGGQLLHLLEGGTARTGSGKVGDQVRRVSSPDHVPRSPALTTSTWSSVSPSMKLDFSRWGGFTTVNALSQAASSSMNI